MIESQKELEDWIESDGGQAFPLVYEGPDRNRHVTFGLTARDYFAGQALMGLITREGILRTKSGSGTDEDDASRCYQIADAMLLERSKEKAHATNGATPPQDSQ